MDLDRLLSMDEERFRRILLTMLELRSKVLDELSVEQKRLVKTVQVKDLKGLGAGVFSATLQNPQLMSKIKDLIRASSEGHPETVYRVVLLNVPAAFYAFWAVLSPWLPSRAKKKLVCLAHSYDPLELWKLAGAQALVALTQLRFGGLPPQEAKVTLLAGDYFELSLLLEEGKSLSWHWQADEVMDFTLWPLPVVHSQPFLTKVAQSAAASSGSFKAQSGGTLCHLRWSSRRVWMGSTELTWSANLLLDSEDVAVGDMSQIRHRKR
jgi:hypothetical protein